MFDLEELLDVFVNGEYPIITSNRSAFDSSERTCFLFRYPCACTRIDYFFVYFSV